MKQHDRSDGESLRRHIDRQDYNKNYDDGAIVAEVEKVGKALRGKSGTIPNFMIRHKKYKLIMPKTANSKVIDMLYHLGRDPSEERNLLGKNGQSASDRAVGKAEHLRILLIDWMDR